MSVAGFLVRWTYRDSGAGLYGWHARTDKYPERDVAQRVYEALPPIARAFRVELFDATGSMWKRLAVRNVGPSSVRPTSRRGA